VHHLLTIIVPDAFAVPQPPINGILYVKVLGSVGVPLMVIVLFSHTAVTPFGKPVAVSIPVALMIVCLIGVRAVPTDVVDGVLGTTLTTDAIGLTMMVPVAFSCSQTPTTVNGIVYLKVPGSVGVPVILIMLSAQTAVTPVGKPVAVPIPVAPVVLCVIAVSAVLIHNVGALEAASTLFVDVTVIFPVAFTAPTPPVKGMLYLKVPDSVGVPVIVIMLPTHVGVTPFGNPVARPIPVAPVVICMIDVSGVHTFNT